MMERPQSPCIKVCVPGPAGRCVGCLRTLDEIAAWGAETSGWVPPSTLGPLPEDLRERAARLLQHQLAVAERLVERITQSQRQRDVAARMSYGPSRPVAAFFDQGI